MKKNLQDYWFGLTILAIIVVFTYVLVVTSKNHMYPQKDTDVSAFKIVCVNNVAYLKHHRKTQIGGVYYDPRTMKPTHCRNESNNTITLLP